VAAPAIGAGRALDGTFRPRCPAFRACLPMSAEAAEEPIGRELREADRAAVRTRVLVVLHVHQAGPVARATSASGVRASEEPGPTALRAPARPLAPRAPPGPAAETAYISTQARQLPCRRNTRHRGTRSARPIREGRYSPPPRSSVCTTNTYQSRRMPCRHRPCRARHKSCILPSRTPSR
jgi:hypothetical protein